MEDFKEELWGEIRKEYGEHFMRRFNYPKADEYFRQSLQHKPNLMESVYRLANLHARDANLDESLKILNEKSGLAEFKHHYKCNLQECDCHYENNDFELGLLHITRKARRYQEAKADIPHSTSSHGALQWEARKLGPKVLPLTNRFRTVCTNFDDMIGKNAGKCLFNHRKYFDKVMAKWKPDTWAQPPIIECDVVSIDEGKPVIKSVREQYRLMRLKRKFAEIYMPSAWKDFEFIRSLKTNETWLKSDQSIPGFANLNAAVDDCVEKTQIMIQQLHARCPMYTFSLKEFPDPKYKAKANRIRKFHLQTEARREMFNALEAMNELRAKGELKKLIEIADHELAYHFQIKPPCLMPRKMEFQTEICNLIGLAHLDKLKLPQPPLDDQPDHFEMLKELLKVSFKENERKPAVKYVFGDRSTYLEVDTSNKSYLVFKENVKRMEHSLKYASIAIEKCHWYHEMGKQNLKQDKNDETRALARRVIEEADEAGSYLWTFLGHILICKADAAQRNAIKINESLKAAQKLVGRFENPDLVDYVAKALEISEKLLKPRKSSSSRNRKK